MGYVTKAVGVGISKVMESVPYPTPKGVWHYTGGHMAKVFRLLRQTVKAALQPYRVEILDLESGRESAHKAWTQVEALEWMRCYGRSYGPHVVRVKTRMGRVVASSAHLA